MLRDRFATASIIKDTRKDDGETRYITNGLLGARGQVLVSTGTTGGI